MLAEIPFAEGTDCISALLEPGNTSEHGYSPPSIIRVNKNAIRGEPKWKGVSTSFVDKQNLTVRMQTRRFTRLTDAFRKSIRHPDAACALHFFHYNFMRIHESLRGAPRSATGHLKASYDVRRIFGR